MDGSWQGQGSGLGSTGWMPLYMAAQGYGMPPGQQQQPMGAPPQGQGAVPQGQGAPLMPGQPPMQGQTPGQAPQFPQGFQQPQQGGPMPLGTSTQGVPSPMMPQGTGQGFNQYGKPPSMSNFLPQQGRQIMGNPTSSFVGQGSGIASAMRPGQYD